LYNSIILFFTSIRIRKKNSSYDKRAGAANDILKSLKKYSEGSHSLDEYCLYLRPFEITETIPSQDRDEQYSSDFESILDRALSPKITVVGIGGPEFTEGIAKIDFSFHEEIDNWQVAYKILAKYASLIIAIPSSHKGTLWELKWLVENKYLDKTIFFMPNTISLGYDHETEWNRASEALNQFNVELPVYHKGGMFFILNGQGYVADQYIYDPSATFLRVQRIKKAIRNLGRGRTQYNVGRIITKKKSGKLSIVLPNYEDWSKLKTHIFILVIFSYITSKILSVGGRKIFFGISFLFALIVLKKDWPRKEKVVISQDKKSICLIRKDGTKENYFTTKLKDLRVVNGVSSEWKVAFSYQGKTINFGKFMNRNEANQVVKIIASSEIINAF
jgi:hypothetical protein